MPDMFKEEIEAKLKALINDAQAAGYTVMTR